MYKRYELIRNNGLISDNVSGFILAQQHIFMQVLSFKTLTQQHKFMQVLTQQHKFMHVLTQQHKFMQVLSFSVSQDFDATA